LFDATETPATGAPPLYVVTGASSDIGQAIVRKLALSGRATLALGRDQASLSALEADFPQRIQARCLELTDDAAVVALARELNAQARAIAGVIHCAGLHLPGPLATTDVADMDLMYRVIVHAAYLLTQQLLPGLERAGGHVLFINSTAALAGRANLSGYAVSRSGLRALADSMRDEMHERGVRVTSIYLGRTATRLIARIFRGEGRPYKPEQLLQPADVADTVLFALDLPATAEVVDIRLVAAIKSY
jgi:NADP-dependent 3-hydroxy acid dehydrogenase YdfG